jgi:hypothetical protein
LIERLSEKYLKKVIKKVIGDNEIEDALKRLDRLTQEEARMVAAQLLKISTAINSGVGEIADHVLVVDDTVAGVNERMAGVADGVDRIERSWFPKHSYRTCRLNLNRGSTTTESS